MSRKVLLIPLALLLAVSLVAIGCPAPAPAPETVTIQYWTCPLGTNPYYQSHAVNALAKKAHPWLRFEPVETTGFVWNLVSIVKQPKDFQSRIIFGSNPPMLYMAETAMPPFKESLTGFKALFNTQICGHFLITLDPDIKTPADLEGRKLGLGYKAQICYGVSPVVMLEHGYGLVGGENIDIQHIGTTPAVDAMLDGLVDACITEMLPILGTSPMQAVQDPALVKAVGSGKHIYYIPFEHSAIEKAYQATGWPFDPYTFPAGSSEHQDKDLEGYGWPTGMYVMPNFPEDLAYEITKFWYEEVTPVIAEYGAFGKMVSKPLAAWGLPREVFHPGALKYYDEIGVKVPNFEW